MSRPVDAARSGSGRRLLVAWFGGEREILGATKAAREAGYEILDVHTPYAVHGLDAAAGLRPSRLPWICFFLGLSGAAAKFLFQTWTSATSWPVNVGGKPLVSVPAFVPVTFEIMVLFAAVGTVLAFFAVSGLRPGKRPRRVCDGTTNDLFALVLVQDDAAFDAAAAGTLLGRFGLLRTEERIELPDERPARGSFLLRPSLGWGLAAALALIVASTYFLPRTFTEPNSEFLPGMSASVPFDPLSPNPNFPDGKTLRTPPEGSIARGYMPFDSSRADAEAAAVRSLTPRLTPEEAAGREALASGVFATYCQPCHGPAGKGDGTIPSYGFPAPPSLDAPNAIALSDGRIFNILTYGRGNMPPLAHRLPAGDRWLAVEHVRRLQAAAAHGAGGTEGAVAPGPGKGAPK